MKNIGKTTVVLLIAVLIFTGVCFADEEDKMTDTKEVSVIFTHDMHSHMDADKRMKDDKVVEYGGFARLKTAMEDIKKVYPESFVLDGGDFSMGTPYQTVFSSRAAELKMMKYIGFDATTFGNHEFDYRTDGLVDMLKAAEGQGPGIVLSNIDWEKTFGDEKLKKSGRELKQACDDYGVKEYIVIEHGGVKAAVFGLMGERAVDYAPESGLIFEDAEKKAAETVEKIKEREDVDVIICLSHCGTVENSEERLEDTEDYKLAEAVPEIDLIVSGHTHTRLDEAVQVGNTYIVSCGSYNTAVGHVVLKKDSKGECSLKSYELKELGENVKADEAVERELSEYRGAVNEEYFENYGYKAEEVIAENDVEFPLIEDFGRVQGEEPLGNLIADSYKYAVAKAEQGNIKNYEEGGTANGEVTSDNGGVQIAVVPHGVIRGSFIKGDITVADAFNVSSLGYGKDGQPGYPLVKAYLTGKELKAAAEVDVSISDFMGVARLYSSGLEYLWNPNRFILNRAVDIKYDDGEDVKELEDDKLYSVVADLYSCQMLGTVKAQSFGLLKIEPKDRNGEVIDDFEDHIIYDGDRELKAWYALASYIDSFEGNEIPEYYSKTQGRKTGADSWNLVEIFKQPNKIAGMAVAIIFVLATAVATAMVVKKRCGRK